MLLYKNSNSKLSTKITTFALMINENAFSQRQLKVSRLLQKELADIFIREAAVLAPGSMLTITVVRISTDLSVARVYLSIFPSKNAPQVITSVEEQAGHIRYELGKKVKNQLRIVPELKFFSDDSGDYAERINTLLK